jgi:putative membrane protein
LAEKFIWQMIFIVALFMIFYSGNIWRNVFVFGASGILGLAVFGARINEPLFPLLTGMFGISTLIFSLKDKNTIPKQNFSAKTNFSYLKGLLSVFIGAVLGFFTAILPGIGSSTAATVGSIIIREKEARNFLVLSGCITTVNFFMSIAALNVLGKARNGAIVSLMQIIEKPSVLIMIMSALIAAGLAVFIALLFSQQFVKLLQKMNYEIVCKSVILILLILAMVFSGLQGLYVLALSTAIGLYCNYKGVQRSMMMACIMVPVMVYFM